MSENPADRYSLYRLLSPSAKLKLLFAVFLNFAAIGVILGGNTAGFRHWVDLLVWLVIFGGMAVFWAYTFSANMKLLWLLIPAQIVFGPLSGMVFSESGRFGSFLATVPGPDIDYQVASSVLGAALIVTGYIAYIMFVNTEGAKTVRLQTEITLAKGIHDRLVPEIALTGKQMEVYGRSAASNDVGGDMFDVLERDGRLDLYVADVSGHGVRAGMMMGMIKSTIRTRYLTDGDTATVVNDINTVIMQLETPGMFATFAGIQSTDGQTLRYCGAGHPPVLHYHAADNRIARMEAQHIPLGVLSDHGFTFDEVAVARGDVIVIVTDGILEIMDDDDVEFEIEGVESALRKTVDRSPREIHDTIIAAAHANGTGDDDETVLVAKVL